MSLPADRRRSGVAKGQDDAHVAVTPVAWRAKQDLGLEEWLESGRKLGLLGRNVPWWIGDWLHYGNHTYGERYVRAARVTGYDIQTLMNMVYVASHFTPARRRGNLSWSHHAEVVALDPAAQDTWLDRAEAERLSVRCLRQEIRAHVRGFSAEQQPVLNAASEAATVVAPAAHEAGVCPSCGHPLETAAHDSVST